MSREGKSPTTKPATVRDAGGELESVREGQADQVLPLLRAD